MKSSKDPRHKKRRLVVKELFANTFSPQDSSDTTKIVMKMLDRLDNEISTSAPQWPIDKLNRIDLAILRLATYELLEKDTPPKVTIDEAVELAKEFGGESSPSFVNGVLGDVYKRNKPKEEETLAETTND